MTLLIAYLNLCSHFSNPKNKCYRMKQIFKLLLLVLLTVGSCKQSPSTEHQKVVRYLVDTTSIAKIDSTLSGFISSGDLAGVSALIYEKGQEVYFNAFGYADIENQVPMNRQTLVKIYSMTKPITGTALMTLYEVGAFQLDDSVSKYIPEFTNMPVYHGVDATGQVRVMPADRPMTIRDLTRHTAGFGNNNNIPGLSEMIGNADARNQENTLTEMAEKLASVPLWFHPGAQWEYGPCVDVQALLVERISGQAYGDYVREHVLDPLGMKETRYYVPEDDRKRLAAIYRRSEEGVLNRIPDEEAHAFNFNVWPMTPGGSGLTSTLDDYMKFARMLVNEGTLDSATILKPETLRLMATNHLSDSVEERSWLPGKGQVGFGIDFAVRLREPASSEENMGIVGEFFWDGAASTLFWIDPVNEITAVLFVQLFPYDPINLHKNFRDVVYDSHIQKRYPDDHAQVND